MWNMCVTSMQAFRRAERYNATTNIMCTMKRTWKSCAPRNISAMSKAQNLDALLSFELKSILHCSRNRDVIFPILVSFSPLLRGNRKIWILYTFILCIYFDFPSGMRVSEGGHVWVLFQRRKLFLSSLLVHPHLHTQPICSLGCSIKLNTATIIHRNCH